MKQTTWLLHFGKKWYARQCTSIQEIIGDAMSGRVNCQSCWSDPL